MKATEAAAKAASTFRLFEEGAPQLIPFGFRRIDRVLGGSEPGEMSVLAAMTGLAKSRAALTACMQTGGALLSFEDGEETIGARYIAAKTGIDSRRIRLKDLTKPELARVQAVLNGKDPNEPYIVDCVGRSVAHGCECIAALGEAGCKRVWWDYLQKNDLGMDDRRAEVGKVMHLAHGAAAQAGMAITFLSQFRRVYLPSANGRTMVPAHKWDRPERGWLKESGDIENEARCIMFAYLVDQYSADIVVEVDKASYGGEGTKTILRPDASGTLREIDQEEESL